MEFIAFSKLPKGMMTFINANTRNGIKAFSNMSVLDSKMSEATYLQKEVIIGQAKKIVYKNILALDKNLRITIETIVYNNLRLSQEKHIRAIREVKTLHGLEEEAKEAEILQYAEEINHLQDILNQLEEAEIQECAEEINHLPDILNQLKEETLWC